MPGSAVRTFIDPDEYAAAMRQGTVGLKVTQRGNFTAKLSRVELHRIWMQWFSPNLGWIAHIDYWSGGGTIAFQTRPGPNMMRNGHESASTSVTRLRGGQSYYLHAPGATSYGTISLPMDELVSLSEATGERDRSLTDYVILNPPPPALAKLRRLHAAAGRLAEETPEIISNPDAARGLEQALIEAMVGCLADGGRRQLGLAHELHAIVMRRFRRVVEENEGEPLYIPDICRAIGVSERTLRMCCQEQECRQNGTCCCAV